VAQVEGPEFTHTHTHKNYYSGKSRKVGLKRRYLGTSMKTYWYRVEIKHKQE
jgi:hypothetical protein